MVTTTKLYRLTATAVPAQNAAGKTPVSSQPGQHVLVVDDGSDCTLAVVEALVSKNLRPLVLKDTALGESLVGAPLLILDTENVDALEALIQRVKQVHGSLAGVIYLATQPIAPQTPLPLAGAAVLKGIRAAIALARALADGVGAAQFMIFATQRGGALGLDPSVPDLLGAGLESLAHPLALETPQVIYRSVDLAPELTPQQKAEALLAEILVPAKEHSHVFGYGPDGSRQELALEEIPAPPGSLGSDPVVIFAGGARGIGSVCALELARQAGGAKILFLGRTALDPEIKTWLSLSPEALDQKGEAFRQEYRRTHPGESPKNAKDSWEKRLQTLQVFQTLAQIEQLGATARYLPGVDVRDQRSVERSFNEVLSLYGRVDAVVYVAGAGGAATDRILTRKRWEVIDQVVQTKFVGALNFLEASRKAGVQLFLSFGSVAGRFGNTGQVDYACGNALLTGLTRFQNASGQLPKAKMLGWGAWDGVGMAVSGPTKDQLVAYGVQFITPEEGGRYFYEQMTLEGPQEVYVTPSWLGMMDFLVPAEGKATPTERTFRYLQRIVSQDSQAIITEVDLDPTGDPYLNDHRLQGVSWVPGAMGLEVACEAASTLVPTMTAYGIKDVKLVKAIRLVRDESMILRTEAQIISQTNGRSTVQVTLWGKTASRSWIFAELTVLLAQEVPVAEIQRMGAYPWKAKAPEITHLDRDQIYPSESLPHQTGPTYRVIDHMDLQPQLGTAEGQITVGALPETCCHPFVLSDGVFQLHQVIMTHWLNAWCGAPLYFREIYWTPEALGHKQFHARLQNNPLDPDGDPVMAAYVEDRCVWFLKGKGQGGTELNRKPNRPSLDSYPFLSEVAEQTSDRIRARKILNPTTELLLLHHTFFGYVFVPAVYFLEVSIETSARLVAAPPVAVLDFEIHKAMQLVDKPKDLWAEVQIKERFRGGEILTEVRTYSDHRGTSQLHTSGYILHRADPVPLGRQVPLQIEQPLLSGGQAIYAKKRIRNGPIFQVLAEVAISSDPVKGLGHAQLKLQNALPPGCYLPMTLLDGLLQLEAVTRTGYDEMCGIPKTFKRIIWDCELAHSTAVLAQAEVLGQRQTPNNLSYLNLADPQGRVILRAEGSTVTPAVKVVPVGSG